MHDQTGTALSCLSSTNNIMTYSVGTYKNSTNLFYFSNCSVSSFKKTLLGSNNKCFCFSKYLFSFNGLILRSVIKTCLLNSPVTSFAITSATYLFPGQFYTLPQQCQLALGLSATSVGCNVF